MYSVQELKMPLGITSASGILLPRQTKQKEINSLHCSFVGNVIQKPHSKVYISDNSTVHDLPCLRKVFDTPN